VFKAVLAGDNVLGFLEGEIPLEDFFFGRLGKSGKVCLDAGCRLGVGGLVRLAQVFGLLLELLEIGTGGVVFWTCDNSSRDGARGPLSDGLKEAVM
jgi:hypothetical protein